MTPDTGSADLGSRLRQLRTERNLTLAVIAQRSRISLPYLSEVERGRKLPSLDILERLAGTYGLTVVELLSGVDVYDKPRPRSLRQSSA